MKSAERLIGVIAVATALLAGCGGSSQDSKSDPVFKPAGAIRVLSNRADLISGGDALVEVVPHDGVDASQLKVEVDGKDITSAFAKSANGRFLGLVGGLAVGNNRVTASLTDGSSSTMTITNHASTGAILYGPQLQPWQCDPGATDTNCSRPISYSYRYVSTNPAVTDFLPYDPVKPPTDVALTTTDHGKTVPFVVRIETGVQDRDYYNIAVLFDSTKPWSAWSPQDGWNRKLYLPFGGGGCGSGFSQTNSASAPRVLDRSHLSRGFAVMSVSLNDPAHNCNLAVQAEATMMAKEHLIEAYGEVRYTYGFGPSGSAGTPMEIANAYPGLLDGVLITYSFSDVTAQGVEVEDCALMLGYFGRTSTAWTDEQKAAAAGHLSTGVCQQWVNGVALQNNFNPYATHLVQLPGQAPTVLGGCDAPANVKYDATFNPTGVRCTAWDSAATVLGKNAAGFANTLYANVGVQYGRAALLGGTISVEQFVDLNASIGSHNLDYEFQPRRVATAPETMAAGYRSGFINQANNLGRIAIMDFRVPDTNGMHHQFRSWMIRARLDKALGAHQNAALWYNAGTLPDAFVAMDVLTLATD